MNGRDQVPSGRLGIFLYSSFRPFAIAEVIEWKFQKERERTPKSLQVKMRIQKW